MITAGEEPTEVSTPVEVDELDFADVYEEEPLRSIKEEEGYRVY